MDAEYNIPVSTEEGYSPEAIANLDRAVEEFSEALLEIKPEDANVMVFKTLAITMKGRKRRIGDLGNVESPEDPMKIELMIYNKEQIEEIKAHQQHEIDKNQRIMELTILLKSREDTIKSYKDGTEKRKIEHVTGSGSSAVRGGADTKSAREF